MIAGMIRGAALVAITGSCLLCAPVAYAACAPANGPWATKATSSGGRFSAAISSPHLVLNQAASLDIRITKADGTPLAPGANVQLRLLMLAHGHGMTTRPFLKRTDAGTFTADAILLHMAGDWTLFVDVAEGPVTEKIETCLAV